MPPAAQGGHPLWKTHMGTGASRISVLSMQWQFAHLTELGVSRRRVLLTQTIQRFTAKDSAGAASGCVQDTAICPCSDVLYNGTPISRRAFLTAPAGNPHRLP